MVDRRENRGIMVQTSKAATKTGFHNPPPRERPLVLRGSCEGRNAPPLPSRPPERLLSAVCACRDKHRLSADEQCSSLHSVVKVSPWRALCAATGCRSVWRDGIARYSVQERRTASASRVEPWISHLFTPDRNRSGVFVFRSITEAPLIRHFTPSSLRETSSVDAVIAFFQ